jgi:hypothetical protein
VDAFEVAAASILASAQFILLSDTQTFVEGFAVEVITLGS